MSEAAKQGDWVQIHSTVLRPEERAPQVPADTKKVPLEMWQKGYALTAARIGEQIQIRTVTGRVVTGELVSINPRYDHGFGRPVESVLAIGQELRALLEREAAPK